MVLGVAYDGSAFHGFAAQPGRRTVAGALADALGVVLALPAPPAICCAGRTDAGVHALGQVAHADVPSASLAAWLGRRGGDRGGSPGDRLQALARALSRRAGSEIVVWDAAVAAAGFNARRSACGRRYRYDVEPAGPHDPRRARLAWQLEERLELAPMRLACDPLVGEHDFAAFCRRPPDQPDGPIPRRVLEAGWSVLDGPGLDRPLWRFEIEAVAFCHQMVRSIVGLLVAVGRGQARASDVADRLASGSRSGNPPVAPAHGLCLVEVRYPEQPLAPRGARGAPGAPAWAALSGSGASG